MIIIEPCAGLGNRFLGLASAYHWAVKNGEKLVLIWRTECAMGAKADTLFELPKDVKVVNVRDYGYKADFVGQIRYNIVKKHLRHKADYYSDVENILDLYKDKGQQAFEDIIRNHDVKYIRALSEFYDLENTKGAFNFIKPSARVSARVHGTIGDISADSCIGVHIRRSDNKWAIESSPLELFINRMNEEIKKDDNVKFYVASDDEPTINELVSLFGDRIVYMKNKDFTRDSEQGIVDAYAELICLSHSKKIIGSFFSTYSRMAAMFSDIDLEIVQK